ncbi:acyl--CoA ligase [Ruegeria lacuscaerulensis]|uniref:acyl--CoA ligase n=1 Tax=Ruegeria lacuscaerulensis TaxID=55218 RepID=UPI001481579D|nr:acyl--CoA ligase [Ruegeria lacuscaerulensis]
MPHLVAELIAPHSGPANAIGAPGRSWLDYRGLREFCAKVKKDLHQIGVGRGDRVAIVLPNGPEMATAFISVAQVATTAPLNPAYTYEEYLFYLKDLKAKALLVNENEDGPAVQAAQDLGIAILRASHESFHKAGQFSILSCDPVGVADTSAPGEDDVALILHTSGTTSRPKIVPLTQANIYASARNVASSLKLTIDDRCLSIMPLFHIHGLIAAVAASLSAGSQISCAHGFNALSFFSQVAEVDPTWYTAVPTMHQAILARAARNQSIIEQSRLRFLRSSSASLPGPVMEELVATFKAPVIEAYGMTEAAHQMCCNPLPPQMQKPGSVGIAAGPEVRIADETENVLMASREVGEIVISGPNVTPGYESNPQANADNFFEVEGKTWFRTGDQGSFDEENYLQLTGRLKELINRGGEKISPLEVDAILLSHPDVAQAVCFAVPHEKLGEDIAAAVVLAEGASIAGQEVRDFVGSRLAKFKVPSSVVILDEIPKGATGKIQRIGLAAKLGLAEA